jgi:hypothetical protein
VPFSVDAREPLTIILGVTTHTNPNLKDVGAGETNIYIYYDTTSTELLLGLI